MDDRGGGRGFACGLLNGSFPDDRVGATTIRRSCR